MRTVTLTEQPYTLEAALILAGQDNLFLETPSESNRETSKFVNMLRNREGKCTWVMGLWGKSKGPR